MPAEGSRSERDRELFDSIAPHYAAKDCYASSRAARRQRLLQTLRGIELPPDAAFFEVGCGAGYAAEYLAGRYGSFVGLDYSAELIAFAQQQHGGERVAFVAADFYEYPVEPRYDLVFGIGVIHHMVDMQQAVGQMAALLKPGGWLALNEPQRGNPLVHALRRARARTDGAYSDEQAELRDSELVDLISAAGLVDVQVKPQGVWSTPFAEVVLPLQFIATGLSHLAVAADAMSEPLLRGRFARLAWNVVGVGRKSA